MRTFHSRRLFSFLVPFTLLYPLTVSLSLVIRHQTATSLVGNATPATDSDDDPRPQIVQISLSLGVVLGLLVLCVLRSAGPWALNTMGVPMSSSLFKPAMAYLSARLWAAPAVLFIVVAEGAFRGYGDTKIPLVASLVAAAINFVLDPLLMFSPGDKSGIDGDAARPPPGSDTFFAFVVLENRRHAGLSIHRLTSLRSAVTNKMISSR